MEIEWKDIEGFSGEFQISNIASFRRRVWLSPNKKTFEPVPVFYTDYSKYGRVILDSDSNLFDDDYLVEYLFMDAFHTEIDHVVDDSRVFIPTIENKPMVEDILDDDIIDIVEIDEDDIFYGTHVPRNYGVSKSYFENGNLKEEISWKRGKRDGWSKLWYEKGALRSKQFFIKGEAQEPELTFNENGELMNGIEQEFFENGVLSRLNTYKNGLLNGIQMTWYENGFLKYSYYYENGKREGRSTEYDEFGHLICQNHWKDDSFHGRQVEWNCLEKSSEYVIISIEEYKNGKLDGKQSRFDALGKNPSYSYYNNGELIKEQ